MARLAREYFGVAHIHGNTLSTKPVPALLNEPPVGTTSEISINRPRHDQSAVRNEGAQLTRPGAFVNGGRMKIGVGFTNLGQLQTTGGRVEKVGDAPMAIGARRFMGTHDRLGHELRARATVRGRPSAAPFAARWRMRAGQLPNICVRRWQDTLCNPRSAEPINPMLEYRAVLHRKSLASSCVLLGTYELPAALPDR